MGPPNNFIKGCNGLTVFSVVIIVVIVAVIVIVVG